MLQSLDKAQKPITATQADNKRIIEELMDKATRQEIVLLQIEIKFYQEN